MKKIRILVVLIFIVSCIVYGVYTVRENATKDRNVPVIAFEEDEISVSNDMTEEELLAGVTASDIEDGDISESVQIASISRFMSGGKRIVKYIVFDEANNLGSAERVAVLEDYVPPRIYMKVPFRAYEDDPSGSNNAGALIAMDEFDGDLTEEMSVSIEDGPIEDVGLYHIELKVSNSLGDSCRIQIEWEVLNSSDPSEKSKYYPELSDYIFYTKVGEPLDFASYLTGIASMSEKFVFGAGSTPSNITKDKVSIDSSAVDYSTPGEYRVYYSYTTRGGVTATTTAYVVVEGE